MEERFLSRAACQVGREKRQVEFLLFLLQEGKAGRQILLRNADGVVVHCLHGPAYPAGLDFPGRQERFRNQRLFEQQAARIEQQDRPVLFFGDLLDYVRSSGQTAHLVGASAAGFCLAP